MKGLGLPQLANEGGKYCQYQKVNFKIKSIGQMEKSENKHYLQEGSSAPLYVKYHILGKHTCLPDGFGREVT